MKTKILTLFLALVASVGTMFAENSTVLEKNSIYYLFTEGSKNVYVTAPTHGTYTATTIIIPEKVYTVGIQVASKSAIWDIEAGYYNVVGIANNAFSGCTSLTSVTIPEGVTSIGNSAFSNCININNLVIPATVTEIGPSAFYKILNVIYPGSAIGAPWGAKCINGVWEGDVLYNGEKTKVIYCKKTASGTIFLANTVDSIVYDAFSGCKGLTSVIIPNSVTSISSDAFYGVFNIVYSGTATGSPWGARSMNGYIDGWLVYSDEGKNELLTCSINAIGDITIPNSVTSIRSSAFSGCAGLTSVTIPNSVTSIGYNAFYCCDKLNTITIPNGVIRIEEGVFLGCIGLTSVTIPNSVTSIEDNAFANCKSLSSIIIPQSVTNIGEYAFSNCSGLTYITCKAIIPPSCSKNSFYGVNKNTPLYVLSQLVVAYSATEVWKAFADIRALPCEPISGTCGKEDNNLTWILSCDSVLTISGTGTMPNMEYSWSLYRSFIKSVIISDGITNIGNKAFESCTNLTSVTIGNSVTSIGYDAFYNCTSLASVNIPNSVTSIRDYAFFKCASLTSVTIGNGVTSIGSAAFAYCSGLTSVTIGNSVTSISSSAFQNCTSLESINVEEANPNYHSVEGILFDKNITTLIKYPAGKQGSYIIPNSVTSIGYDAFENCTGLTFVTISNFVTKISGGAFRGCTGLTSIIIPNSVTSIDGSTFYGCSGLTSVTIGTGVTTIGGSAFFECKGLASITIPNSVTSIGEYAFYGCSGLDSITIPNSVTTIGKGALDGCGRLTSLTIPNSVTSIGDNAFLGCVGLTSVTIGNGVTSIGQKAFCDCSSLVSIYMESTTPPTIEASTFSNIGSEAIVYVPFGAIEAYKSNNYWKDMNILCLNTISYNSGIMPTGAVIRFDVEDITLQSCSVEGGETFDGNTLELVGLEPNKEYNDISVVLTSNTGETEKLNVSFTTTALELTTQPSKPVSSNTAILLAETNMADSETSCGFEWKRNDAPEDMASNKVYAPVANGTMAGRLKGLKDDVYYKYRAFYKSAAGTMYYGEWQYIFTGDVAVEFDPILYTYAATAVKENEATLKGYALAGSDDFTEQGFEYWADSRLSNGGNAPARMKADLGEHKTVTASGISMKVTLQDLDEGTVYKYRTYAKIGDQVLYGSLMSFTTLGEFEQGLEELREESHSSAHKFLRNGILLIERGGKIFNASGMRVK